MMSKQVTFCVLLLVTVNPLNTGQSLQLVYINRSGIQAGNNRINLECRRDGDVFAVPNPQIWVEQSGPPHRQNVTITGNHRGRVAIEITQDLEGMYFCHYNGSRSTNTLKLVAYPKANKSIPSSYAFQEGQAATIDCQIMPGRLSQYYRVRWMNGSLSIAASDPPSVLPRYQLHDNFSLTINNIKPSDSGTSYRCIVTINDPQITGTDNIVYDQNQLGNITVMVNVLTPSTTPTVMFPTTPKNPTSPSGAGPPLFIILPAVLVPVLGILMVLLVLLFIAVTIIGCRAYHKSHCQATAQGLRKEADKLENKMLKLTPRHPQQERQIEDMRKEVQSLRDKANTKPEENQKMAEKRREDAEKLENQASQMEKELSSVSREEKREREKIIRNNIKDAQHLRKQARRYDKLASDEDASEEKDRDKEDRGELEDTVDATCCNIPNPNTTTPDS